MSSARHLWMLCPHLQHKAWYQVVVGLVYAPSCLTASLREHLNPNSWQSNDGHAILCHLYGDLPSEKTAQVKQPVKDRV